MGIKNFFLNLLKINIKKIKQKINILRFSLYFIGLFIFLVLGIVFVLITKDFLDKKYTIINIFTREIKTFFLFKIIFFLMAFLFFILLIFFIFRNVIRGISNEITMSKKQIFSVFMGLFLLGALRTLIKIEDIQDGIYEIRGNFYNRLFYGGGISNIKAKLLQKGPLLNNKDKKKKYKNLIREEEILELENYLLLNKNKYKIYKFNDIYLNFNKIINTREKNQMWNKKYIHAIVYITKGKKPWLTPQAKLIKILPKEIEEPLNQKNSHNFYSYIERLINLPEKIKSYFINHLENLRRKINKIIMKKSFYKGYKREAGLMIALTIGDRSLMTYELRKHLKKSGTSHLIAISGLHMTSLGNSTESLLSFLRIVNNGGFLENVLYCIVCMILLIFLILSSASFSSQRAFFMYITNILAKKTRGKNNLWVLFLSAFIILTINPYAAFSLSFIMSFLAVFALLSSPSGIIQKTISINIILLPIILYCSKEINILSPLVNLICIPIFSVLIMPIIFLSIFVPPLFFITNILVYLFCEIIYLASIYGFYIQYKISILETYFYTTISIILILMWGAKKEKIIKSKETGSQDV